MKRSIHKSSIHAVLNRMISLSYSIPYVESECRFEGYIRDTKFDQVLSIFGIISENKLDLTVHPRSPFYRDLFYSVTDTSTLNNRSQDMFVRNLAQEIANHFSLEWSKS